MMVIVPYALSAVLITDMQLSTAATCKQIAQGVFIVTVARAHMRFVQGSSQIE